VGPGSPTLKGTRGHLPGPDYMHAAFVAVQNIDVAPTITELMKLKLPAAEGRALKEALIP
jgi:hypothetical protein